MSYELQRSRAGTKIMTSQSAEISRAQLFVSKRLYVFLFGIILSKRQVPPRILARAFFAMYGATRSPQDTVRIVWGAGRSMACSPWAYIGAQALHRHKCDVYDMLYNYQASNGCKLLHIRAHGSIRLKLTFANIIAILCAIDARLLCT